MKNKEVLKICRLAKEAIAVKHDPRYASNDVENMMRKMQEQVAESADLDFMIAAFEKQIPKRIIILNGADLCPECGYNYGPDSIRKFLMTWQMPYCKMCGQRLDWKV